MVAACFDCSNTDQDEVVDVPVPVVATVEMAVAVVFALNNHVEKPLASAEHSVDKVGVSSVVECCFSSCGDGCCYYHRRCLYYCGS